MIARQSVASVDSTRPVTLGILRAVTSYMMAPAGKKKPGCDESRRAGTDYGNG